MKCPRDYTWPRTIVGNKLWARSHCGWKNFTPTLTLKLRVETLRKILTFTYTMNLGVVSQWMNKSGYLGLARAPWVRKVGYLCIREILVVTWSYVRATGIPMENSSINRYGNTNGTWVFWREIAWPTGLTQRKNNNNVSFPLSFNVYADVDNRERVSARDK